MTARLRELARECARREHTEWLQQARLQQWTHKGGHEGTFTTCQHPDCVLVRDAAAGERSEDEQIARACSCKEPDPVMQADGRFYCYTCSFQTGARPRSLEPEDAWRQFAAARRDPSVGLRED